MRSVPVTINCVFEFVVLKLENLLIKNMYLSKPDQITIAQNVNFFLSVTYRKCLSVLKKPTLKFYQLFNYKSLYLWRFCSCSCLTGGLFGSSTFSQPATSSTSTGFGFGAASGTSTSLFGNSATGTTGGLFSQQSNAFSANKPTSFGSEFHHYVSLV